MRREDIDGKRHAKSCPNVVVPLNGKVCISASEERNDPEQIEAWPALNGEVDDQNNAADVNELHDRDFGEHCKCFVILGVVLLHLGYLLEDDADHYVNHNHHQ